MSLNWRIPKEAERVLRATWGDDLDRAAFEALVIEGYRTGKHTSAELGQLLGLDDRWAIERWLRDRGVLLNYTIDDLEADRQTLRQLLGKAG